VHAVLLAPHARFLRPKIEHLGKFESEFKQAFTRESGAQGLLSDEKT
jgi:hypothetical protein